MSDNRRYYYLKLKDNFFESDEMIILESMADGYLYSNILLKLYLRSLKNDGKLMFNEFIPYSAEVLAKVTRHNVGVMEKALDVLEKLGLIEILDNGAIYMLDIQNFIGESSTEADRKRKYRRRIEQEKELISGGTNVPAKKGQMSQKTMDKCPDKSPPEIEIELEIEREIELEQKETKDQSPQLTTQFLNQVIGTWNGLNLTQIRAFNRNTSRYQMLSARVKEYGEKAILEAIENINKSDFLKGQNQRGWVIEFNWLIKPNNFIKVLEGNYTNRERDNDGRDSKGSESKDYGW